MPEFLVIEHPAGKYQLRADQRILRQSGKIRSVIKASNTVEAFRKFEKWRKAHETNV